VSNYIIIKRPLEDLKDFSKRLEGIGLKVFSYPTIKIKKNDTIDFSEDLKRSDWIIFTSKNGIRYFLDKADIDTVKKRKIAVVGPKTAEEAKTRGMKIDFIPKIFTTKDLGKEIPIRNGEKIFLPRADIASKSLIKILEKRGAIVFNIPIYRTQYLKKESQKLEKLLLDKNVKYLSFTSPSTIDGFMKGLKNEESKKAALGCRVISIGPVTTRKAREMGFKTVITADIYTTNGIIKKLQEVI
jgi:uroporphyrinogen-III synthase